MAKSPVDNPEFHAMAEAARMLVRTHCAEQIERKQALGFSASTIGALLGVTETLCASAWLSGKELTEDVWLGWCKQTFAQAKANLAENPPIDMGAMQ